MATLNAVHLLGYLARDPELRYTPSGKCVCQFGIGINRKWKTADGSQKEKVSFIDCTAWETTGEIIGSKFRKGQPILVSGYLDQESWDDKQTGQKRNKLNVIVQSFSFVSPKDDASDSPKDDAPQRRNTPAPATFSAAKSDDDEVPF